MSMTTILRALTLQVLTVDNLDIRYYANKLIYKAYDTKFLGIYVNSRLSWKIHIEQIKSHTN
jgi:hypothetical protein